MTAWTVEEVGEVGDAEELDIAARRADGTLGRFVTIWVVRTGDDLFVRSVNGRSGTWFRGALAAGEGRIRAGDIERDVAFEEADPVVYAAVTGAYHAKYDRYGPSIVGTVVSQEAEKSTLMLVPR
jgi:hypothetical protein